MNIIDSLTQSRDKFFHFVEVCNREYREGNALMFYREIINQHRKIANLKRLIASEKFLQRLYRTLEAWGMNKRGARLVDFASMSKSIRNHVDYLKKLYRFRLEMLSTEDIQEVLTLLRVVFCKLEIMNTRRRIVGVSKALHFLLPDLVMPIDSSNTMIAFYGYNRYGDNPEKEFNTYSDIFIKTHTITKSLNLTESDVDRNLWSCSVPKLIDNAIFGLFIEAKKQVKKSQND